MPFPREDHPKQIADRLHELAAKLKPLSRQSYRRQTIPSKPSCCGFFNTFHGWQPVNLNAAQRNHHPQIGLPH